MDCSLPGFSVHGILQARILKLVAMPSSRGSSRSRDQTRISYVSCIGSEFFTTSATWEEIYMETRDSGKTELYSLRKMRGSILVIAKGITEPRSPCMSKVLLKGLRGLLSTAVTVLTRKKKMLLVPIYTCFIFFNSYLLSTFLCQEFF